MTNGIQNGVRGVGDAIVRGDKGRGRAEVEGGAGEPEQVRSQPGPSRCASQWPDSGGRTVWRVEAAC